MQAHTALIIDDNWYNGDIFKIALEDANYEVIQTTDGMTGLRTLEERSFDLLILDLSMPEVDGLQVLRCIRNQRIYDTMLIIIITANPAMVTDEINSKAEFVMYKPIDIMAFSAFVKRLQKHRPA